MYLFTHSIFKNTTISKQTQKNTGFIIIFNKVSTTFLDDFKIHYFEYY